MENGGARELADRLLMEHLAERRARANQVLLVAELAEHYVLPDGAEATHPVLVDALAEEVFPVGGPGAPNVSEFAALEIAALLRISKRKATIMIHGALHLKWQLPGLYEQVERLIIDGDRAVQASYAVSVLPPDIAAKVVDTWAQVQERYSWAGAFKKLNQMIAEADRFRAADEAKSLDTRGVKVSTGSPSADFSALGYVEATVDVLDAKLFDAALSQIAELLASVHGDQDPWQVRRAKAVGVLSRPAYALALIQHRAKHLPSEDHPRLFDHDHGDPHTDPDAGGGRYLPAGCAGHVCGTIDVPLARLQPTITVDVVIEADAVGTAPTARIDDAANIAVETLAHVLEGKTVKVQPVIDLPRLPAEDQYRPSVAMRRAVLTRWRTEAFPFSTTGAKRLDLDHVTAWLRTAGPGQTNQFNLIPETRRLHRAKTARFWMVTIDEQHRAIWTSPLGYQYTVTPYGTEPLLPLQLYGRDYPHHWRMPRYRYTPAA